MISAGITTEKMARAIGTMARDLVRAERMNGVWYVSLPMLYPDGSFVTLRLHQAPGGIRVSNSGFAYREAERVESARKFKRTAKSIAELTDVTVGERSIFVLTAEDEMERAVIDVAETSRRVAEQICRKAWDSDDDELPLALRDRLANIFGADLLEEGVSLRGRSTSEWKMSSVVHLPDRDVVFQAVRENGNSINKASTAFRDLSELSLPPRLIAVVASKEAIGSRLSLLAPALVLEDSQPDDLFLKAAEAA